MAIYVEDYWKCPEHPSDDHREGVCPKCLYDRLAMLCPDCASVRSCSCSCSAAASSGTFKGSSSRFSSFSSRFSVGGGGGGGDGVFGKEPAFRKSRSTGTTYLFSRLAGNKDHRASILIQYRKKISSFWCKFKSKFNWGSSSPSPIGEGIIQNHNKKTKKY